MMGLRLEVGFKDRELDARSAVFNKKLASYLSKRIEDVRILDVSYIDLDLSQEQAELIASDLLADPILQEYSFEAELASGFDWVIEVGPLPGVTDNVGRTTAEAVNDMLSLDRPSDFVRSAQAFAISGEPDREDIEHICVGLLVNPLVQSYRVMNGSEYRNLEFSRQATGSPHEPRINSVELPEDDRELELLSKRRLLALNISEMRAVRDYFRRQDVRDDRRDAGMPPDPTDVELETLAQTWSEHCQHKIFNSKIVYSQPGSKSMEIDSLFKTFIKGATEQIARDKDWLVSVFSDNAGIISFNDKDNIVFKVETHNHPSALDPYGGALTGILGVNRDPMGTGVGAELIFNTDVFCFGLPDKNEDELPPGILHPSRIFSGVRKGVEDGGNKVGIPTVNGAILFDEDYTYNPLVFCGTGGIMPKKIGDTDTSAKPIEPGDLIVMVGGRIGKDGIHGATFSSVKLEEEIPPTVVQIGAPIIQKKMMDALLEARDRGLYRTITDNGAGGLSSSVGEMAEISAGAEVDLEKAPLKYHGLDPWEIWVSESQERMTLAVQPDRVDDLLALFDSRDVEATVIGRFTDDGYLNVRYDGEPALRLDIDWLHNGWPRLELKARWERNPDYWGEEDDSSPMTIEPSSVLRKVMSSLNICSKESVIRQYDHEVQGTSVVKPLVGRANDGPSDAAVIKPRPGAQQGVVVSCGINPKYGLVDPYAMALSAVDEAVRNAVAVGADPDHIAILDNFCWGNPIKSEANPDGDYKLGQLVRAAGGCRDAAVALGTPFISGKDSFHNEYDLGDRTAVIPPTLLISAMGVMPDVDMAVTMDVKNPEDLVYVLGLTKLELGGSHYAEMIGCKGRPPSFDSKSAPGLYAAFHRAVRDKLVASCHDCSEGGLAVALTETAFAGGLGLEVDVGKVKTEGELSDTEILFSESNSRLVVTVPPVKAAAFELVMEGCVVSQIGEVTLSGQITCVGVDGRIILEAGLDELRNAWQKPLAEIE